MAYKESDADFKESINEEAHRIINNERAAQYGPPKKNFQDIANGWNNILKNKHDWIGPLIEPEDVALMMIWLKMCRYQN